jgi:hypothetical protein
MANEQSFFDRLSQWFQDRMPSDVPQQTDKAVESDADGFFVHVACYYCDNHLRLRINRSFDLEREEGGGFVWRKTILDGRCFRKMEARVFFDNAYRVVEKEIEGGRFVGRDAWATNR